MTFAGDMCRLQPSFSSIAIDLLRRFCFPTKVILDKCRPELCTVYVYARKFLSLYYSTVWVQTYHGYVGNRIAVSSMIACGRRLSVCRFSSSQTRFHNRINRNNGSPTTRPFPTVAHYLRGCPAIFPSFIHNQ